jgi:hypothetical protein
LPCAWQSLEIGKVSWINSNRNPTIGQAVMKFKSKISQYRFDHPLRLYNISDVHRGNEGCNANFFHQIIDEVATNPHAYWVSTSDLGECATKNSKSESYGTMSPGQELEVLEEELQPIAHKCLGFVYSNHHKRIYQAAGMSFDKVLAKTLQIPYIGMTGLIALTVGRGTYYVMMHHGVGGGTRGNKINRAKKFSEQRPGADLYLTGHTHTYEAFYLWQKYIDRKRLITGKFMGWHQIAGHFIDYDESYADSMMLEESPVACGVTDLGYCSNGKYKSKDIDCQMVIPN